MLQNFSHYLTYQILGIKNALLAESVNFFIADSIKIIALLIIITQLMSLVRYYLPIQKLKNFLTSKKLYGLDYFLAAIFGAITPFCTCSSIPIFIGFLQAQIPLGVTFAFLITSPLVNEVAVIMLFGIFGLKVAIIYAAAGILIGVIGGYLLGRLKMEKYVAAYISQPKNQPENITKENLKFKKVLVITSAEAFGIIKQVVPYLLIGIALGAAIHGFVPQGFFEKYITKQNIFAVPLAVIFGVPLYSNATGVIPIIQALVAKGIPLGTALAFMMATVGLSLPEALILKKVIKLPLLLAFFGLVSGGIILLGYFFNFIF
ncbi:MAG: permease [Patescibacteria group bacterium]|jgi:hypothetical protein